ncbi:regulator of G-protein signaling 14 isoform X3 [Denticeps clupeoides]|uniref:regulator of G-protein signaling 14 isoform X3 n=1 Tax=Denticeps clupeoides TaxID=299321 RepID=UPI0010A31431|nr:regulator of G-protein signaling 14-like isoform X3 [Denticeps clupeoides]
MSLKLNSSGITNGIKTLAVSDGELNAMEPDDRSSSHCSSSNTSLPSVPSDRASGVGQVASWAVSFERLLEDPMGVRYFTAFLKSEVSAENILFWQACEKFRKIPATQTEQLKVDALAIYKNYISDSAPSPVNIDDTARTEESTLQKPHPDMFQKAQQQIFKLMKFDSYSRFVRSQLYQNCMLADVEGKPLPEIGPRSKNPGAKNSPSQQKPDPKQKEVKTKAKVVKPVGAEAEDGTDKRKVLRWDKSQEKRESWGDPQKMGAALLAEKPLSLDQDSSVLKDQQVFLELRITLAVRIVFTGKTVTIVAKSNKTLQEALTTILQKHNLRPQEALVTLFESREPLNMSMVVTPLANKTILLDRARSADTVPGSAHGPHVRRGGVGDLDVSLSSGQIRTNIKQRNPVLRRAYDMDGLVELLNRAQCCSAEDQRGLLRKEHLMLPAFLQLPLGEVGEEEVEKDRPMEESKETSFQPRQESAATPSSDTTPSPTPGDRGVLAKDVAADAASTGQGSDPGRETVV